MWKHTLRRDVIDKKIRIPDNLFIIMYKNVYNWVYSVRQNPYDISFQENGEVMMQQIRYPNIVMLYKRYYAMYHDYLEKYKNIVWIDYHKMLDPHNGFKYIKDRLAQLGIELVDDEHWKNILSNPSKNHGSNIIQSSDDALRLYKDRQIQIKSEQLSGIDHNIFTWFEDES
jgi:hypothetical protein